MKVLIIYSSDVKQKVNELRQRISNDFGKDSVLRLHSTERKKSIFRHAWHKDAIRMMQLADLIVYAVSSKSSVNNNVNWELKKALKLKKHIVYLPMEPGVVPQNPCLYKQNKNTKELDCLAENAKTEEKLFKMIREFDESAYLSLFHEPIDPDVLLEQYKIFQETSENLVTRRQNVNSFYISANTALITIGGTIFAIGSEGALWSKLAVIIALSIPGILLNVSWYRMLQSYYINNQGKIKVLSEIEKKLAASMYDAEWKAMKNKYSKKKYVSFTDNEKKLPMVFTVFFALIDILCAVALLVQ